MTRTFTVVNLFSGIHGCTLGFKRAGFRSLAAIDFDAKACEQGRRLTGSPTFCRDIAAMQPGELLAMVGPVAPDVLVMSPPCKSFSGCMPAARAGEAHYVDMSQLAVRATFLALETWKQPPGLILIENVPRIQTRGAPLLAQIVALLQRSGYATDQGTHDCGVIGGLAQHRERFLLVARHMERVPSFLRKPLVKRVRNVGEVLLPLPSPAADHGDHMHRLPLLSPLNWLRLAAIRAGKDWRDLPTEIRIGGAENPARHAGKLGVEDFDAPAHTVVGRGNRPGSGWSSVADPRVGFAGPNTQSGILGVEDTDAPAHTVTGNARGQGSRGAVADPRVQWDRSVHGGRPDSYGVGTMEAPSLTVRAQSLVQTSRASIADPRLGDRPARQNGGFGVEAHDAPAHSVLGEGTVRNTRASFADPRLSCEPRSGAYGVQSTDQPGATVVGHHAHDNSPGSMADPRLAHTPRRGTMGVIAEDEPAPTIRGHHEVRQATAAVVDSRGWPLPTHELVIEDGAMVLYGPPLDLVSKRSCYLVIRAPDGTWHRPLTDRELATLQGFPTDHQIEGPRSSSKTQAGVREWIGNAIPVDAAEAIGREAAATLRSAATAGFLRGGDVWVERADAVSLAGGAA
jgi:site-specific DNA-cytosine methylase